MCSLNTEIEDSPQWENERFLQNFLWNRGVSGQMAGISTFRFEMLDLDLQTIGDDNIIGVSVRTHAGVFSVPTQTQGDDNEPNQGSHKSPDPPLE